MAELHVLTAPTTFVAPQSITDYKVLRFLIDRSTPISRLLIVVRSNTGVVVEAVYTGIGADPLISALNTANLSTKSLEKRILERLATDGFIPAGSVTGTPD